MDQNFNANFKVLYGKINIGNVCVIGQKEKTSIHSKSSQEFMREVVKAGSWQLNIMENGFMPDLGNQGTW